MLKRSYVGNTTENQCPDTEENQPHDREKKGVIKLETKNKARTRS